MLIPLDLPQNTISTPNEDSFCSGDHNVQTGENNQDKDTLQ